MVKAGSVALSAVKYVYLVFFFALLSGMFYPLIEGGSIDPVIIGVLILFVALAGGLLLYKAGTTDKRRVLYLGGGFGILAIALVFVFSVAGYV